MLPRQTCLLIYVWLATVALAASTSVPAQVAAPAKEPAAYDRVVAGVRATYQAVGSPESLGKLPIGVFDSGTGGLTVLEEILSLDEFDNRTHAPARGGDGRPDFEAERFEFLADQANMPYGQYPGLGKRDFLVDLAVKDAQFLLGTGYHASATSKAALPGKPPVKVIVIACNTATAHGKDRIEAVIGRSGVGVKVIGVIDAGAEGALDALDGGGATVGVLATKGTVLSGAYPAAIRALAARRGVKGPIRVVQQGSLGLAGAIDGAPEFIAPGAVGSQARRDYQGPSLENAETPIRRELLARFDFDFASQAMLFEGDWQNPSTLQLNSVANYVAYDTTMLLENMREAGHREPLRAVILGCTHFPFVADAIRAELERLYDYQEEGRYVYRALMAENIVLVDPAFYTARAAYTSLAGDRRLAQEPSPARGNTRGQFYITVPYRLHTHVRLDPTGWFTFDYKYGRTGALEIGDVRTVPITPAIIGKETCSRLRQRVPGVWRLMDEFARSGATLPERN